MYKQIDCFSKNLKFWKFLGIFPLDMAWFYAYYSKIFVSFLVTYTVLCTINFYFMPRHIDNFIEELILYFTELAVVSKVLTFVIMKDKIRDILSMLESDIFQPGTTKAIKIIKDAKEFNVRYWKIVAGFSTTSNIAHLLSPLVTHLLLKVELVLPVSTFSFLSDAFKQKYIYPLYFYQSIGMHFIMLYDVNIDTFILGLMIFIIAQLEILEEKFSNVTKDCAVEAKGLSSVRVPENDAALISKLNKIIIHHNLVIKFCNLTEEVFSISLFVQFSVASCIICICLFRFMMPAPVLYYVFLTTYMFVMVVLILVPSWFGTRIIDKSCLLSHAIYCSDWTPRSKHFKSSMLLLILRTNRPLSITGCKMVPLSLRTFTSIMNTAYSFYTLLRNVQFR